MKNIEISDKAKSYIILSVVSLLMAIVFINVNSCNAPIETSEAVVYTGTFDYYEEYTTGRGGTDYLDLYFSNGEKYTVHHTCVSDDLMYRLTTLDGDKLTISVNPNHGYVVELLANGQEILNFDDAQSKIKNEGIGFMLLGIVFAVFALLMFGHGIIMLVKSRKKMKKV